MAYTNANLSMYADDHQIYAAGCHLDEVEKNLNREGETATRWCKDNLLQGNHDKYQVMTVSNKNQDSSITVSVDGSNIQSSTDLKLLGVTIDNRMTFNAHIRDVCKKTSMKIGALRLLYVRYGALYKKYT